MKPCNKCLKPINDDQIEKAPRCDSCRVFFHLDEKCSGLCVSEQRAIVVQKRIMLFFCDACVLSFKKIPLLTNKFIQLEDQVKSLKEEVETLKKQQTSQQNLGAPANMESMLHEIEDRAERANNLMVYGVPESASGSMQEKIDNDNVVLAPILHNVGLAQDDVLKVLRVGQASEGGNRPIRVVTKHSNLVKNAMRRRNRLEGNIRLGYDKTKLQREQFKAVLSELRNREQRGETDLIIKFVNGSPSITKKSPPKNRTH